MLLPRPKHNGKIQGDDGFNEGHEGHRASHTEGKSQSLNVLICFKLFSRPYTRYFVHSDP